MRLKHTFQEQAWLPTYSHILLQTDHPPFSTGHYLASKVCDSSFSAIYLNTPWPRGITKAGIQGAYTSSGKRKSPLNGLQWRLQDY